MTHLKKSSIEALEAWASDDLRVLEEVGVEGIPSDYLTEMARESENRIRRIERWQKASLVVGVSSLVWLVFALGAALLGHMKIAAWAVRIFPLSLMAFVIGVFAIRYVFGSLGALYSTKEAIRGELLARSRKIGASSRRE